MHDGTPLSLPLVSQGSQTQVTGTIPVNGAVTLESVGDIGGNLSQGWGLLTTTNSIGGTVIFRQTVPGKQVSEAAVPLTKPISTMLILPYDNTTGAFTTAAALVNPDPNNTAVITANLYDQSATRLVVASSICRRKASRRLPCRPFPVNGQRSRHRHISRMLRRADYRARTALQRASVHVDRDASADAVRAG